MFGRVAVVWKNSSGAVTKEASIEKSLLENLLCYLGCNYETRVLWLSKPNDRIVLAIYSIIEKKSKLVWCNEVVFWPQQKVLHNEKNKLI